MDKIIYLEISKNKTLTAVTTGEINFQRISHEKQTLTFIISFNAVLTLPAPVNKAISLTYFVPLKIFRDLSNLNYITDLVIFTFFSINK